MRVRTVGIVAALSIVCGLGCDEVSFPSPATEEFVATLSGAGEVPPVTTSAAGTAVFGVLLDTVLTYRIDIATTDTPTVAHIHEGAAGVPGAVIVTLYGGPTRNTADYGGPLGIGQFVPSQLTQLPVGFGATARARFDSLVTLMRAGGVYVNVHTLAHSGGEIRGQIQPQ